ncbi:MAG: dihydrodipicolinate synthase family protein, partial [Deltaproteobacteria bacterium]|nr:dihydrodipicolinate synthase family protein [Deltaproteobacteria bacterium]
QIPVASYWYDVPAICRIAHIDQVVAYKEASFSVDVFTEIMRELEQQGCTMQVLTGNDRFVAQSYILGANGALIGIANLATEKWAAIDGLARAGNHQEAMVIQEELRELQDLVFGEPIVEAVARIKTILRYQGIIKTDVVRRPQLGVTLVEKKNLIESYCKLGLAQVPERPGLNP